MIDRTTICNLVMLTALGVAVQFQAWPFAAITAVYLLMPYRQG